MGVLQGHGSHTPLQDEGEMPVMDLVKREASEWTQRSDADSGTPAQKQKPTVVNVDREHRDGCTN